MTKAPDEVKIEITAKCNLDCQFCYNANSFTREIPDLSRQHICELLDQMANLGIRRVRFTGGEPFLRKDLLCLLEYAKLRELYVIVNTNGTLIDKKNLRQLSKLVDRFLLPFHSLQSEKTKKMIELIEMMKKNNIRFCLNTILTKQNIKNLEMFFCFFRKLKFDWFLARPIPTQRNKMPINNEDVRILIEKLNQFRENYGYTIAVDNIPFCAYNPKKVSIFSRGARYCGIFNKLVVDPTGKIKPCYSINEENDEIAINDLSKAWENGLSREIRDLKKFPVICKKCKYLHGCLGGCRFAAKFINGDYNAMDPLAKPEVFLSH